MRSPAAVKAVCAASNLSFLQLHVGLAWVEVRINKLKQVNAPALHFKKENDSTLQQGTN